MKLNRVSQGGISLSGQFSSYAVFDLWQKKKISCRCCSKLQGVWPCSQEEHDYFHLMISTINHWLNVFMRQNTRDRYVTAYQFLSLAHLITSTLKCLVPQVFHLIIFFSLLSRLLRIQHFTFPSKFFKTYFYLRITEIFLLNVLIFSQFFHFLITHELSLHSEFHYRFIFLSCFNSPQARRELHQDARAFWKWERMKRL